MKNASSRRVVAMLLAAWAAGALAGCQVQSGSTVVPFLGQTRKVNYTYRFIPKRQDAAGVGKAAIVVVAELPFLHGGLEGILRHEGLPPDTRTSRNTFSAFHGFTVSGNAAVGGFRVRNRQYGPAFGTELSDVTVAVDLRLTPAVDRRGELVFDVATTHRKVSGTGLATFIDEWSAGQLLSVQAEIDKALAAARREVPSRIPAGFSGQDVAPDKGPIRKLTLVKARFVSTPSSPVAMEFVFTPG
jgi:hypothetical protein